MQTTDGDTRPSPARGASWSVVAAFALAVDAALDKWLSEEYRVGLTEFRALTVLSQATDVELRISELAQQVGLNQSSATRLVSRLETKGLAQREMCAVDGRGIYAVLSEHGGALVQHARGPYDAKVGDVLREASSRTSVSHTDSLVRALRDVEHTLGG